MAMQSGQNDPDPFVRACLFENPNAFRDVIGRVDFGSGLERFAYARNPEIASSHYRSLLEGLLDLSQERGVDIKARKQVALAMITNPAVIKNSRLRDPKMFVGGAEGAYGNLQSYSKLWKLAVKWPLESGVAQAVCKFIEADDSVKAEIYKEYPDLRDAILENCTSGDFETLDLALADEKEWRQKLAYEIRTKVNTKGDTAR